MIDFDFSCDITPYVSPTWDYVAVVQPKNLKNAEPLSLRAAVEEYTSIENKIKKIVCKKQITGWDLRLLRDRIKQTIRNAGYQRDIAVVRKFHRRGFFQNFL